MQPEPEAGGDPEVAAAAPDGPEQVGVVLVVDLEDLAVGGDQLGREQVVDGQAVLADQEPDPAAEGQPPIPTEPVSPNPVASPCSPTRAV